MQMMNRKGMRVQTRGSYCCRGLKKLPRIQNATRTTLALRCHCHLRQEPNPEDRIARRTHTQLLLRHLLKLISPLWYCVNEERRPVALHTFDIWQVFEQRNSGIRALSMEIKEL